MSRVSLARVGRKRSAMVLARTSSNPGPSFASMTRVAVSSA